MTRKLAALLIVLGTVVALPANADDEPKAESPLVKMLKKGNVPADRQGTIVEMIGKRGGPADLGFLFSQATRPDGFPEAVRLKALDALAEAALTRQAKPEGDLKGLGGLIKSPENNAGLKLAALRLAALWKAEDQVPTLKEIAGSTRSAESLRAGAFDALASIGGKAGTAAIEGLTGPGQSKEVRVPAVGALAKLDANAAADRAVALLKDPSGSMPDLVPLVAPFLNRQGGAETLAAALAKGNVPADSAKLALRAVYALGRADADLVTELTRAAGLDAEVKPLDQAAMNRVIADVSARGDAARGEMIFRRADLNCARCHALSGAGGGVGPELSAVGSTSPVDYLVNSIMLPDQAIKEQYVTKVVLTTDGRVYHGIVVDRDDKRLVLKEATGDNRTIPAADIEADKDGGSLMPKGLVNFLTRDEFLDLVRFLSELGKPGPYAIRSAQTIQRWRVLRTSPDPSAFKDQVLAAPDDAWLPAYAKVAGALPLDEFASIGKVLYLQGEVDVSSAGPVTVKLDSADGVTAWVDDKAASVGKEVAIPLDAGHHRLTFRVDTSARKGREFRVEVARAEGSSAEFAVAGGR